MVVMICGSAVMGTGGGTSASMAVGAASGARVMFMWGKAMATDSAGRKGSIVSGTVRGVEDLAAVDGVLSIVVASTGGRLMVGVAGRASGTAGGG